MLRTLLLLIALIVVIGIALVSFGIIDLTRDRDGTVRLQTRDVEVGTTSANVQVPVLKMENRTVEVPEVAITGGNAAAPANTQ